VNKGTMPVPMIARYNTTPRAALAKPTDLGDTQRMAANLHSALKQLKQLHLKDADWVGFREVRETCTTRSMRDAKPEANSTSTTHGVMVEVLANGQFGYAATPRLDDESLAKAAETARDNAVQASRWAVHPFTAAQRPPVRTNYQSPVVRGLTSISPREMNALLAEICVKLKRSDKIIRTEATSMTIETETSFVSTNGSDANQKVSLVILDFDATAQDGSVVQRRSGGGRGRAHQGGWEQVLADDLWQRVDLVADQVLELVAAEECPSETTSLVLKPDQMMLQIHESIGHPLELDRILGDERNYAGWSFVKLEDFGRLQYGSRLMNVTFDPTVSNEMASYGFDDTGVAATREFLIRDGVLQRGLGSLESQLRSKVPGVANARACSWNRAPIDRMANINLEPGTSSFNEIVSGVERGVLMETNRSWSIDDFRNKFQFGCEYAKLIENGKITRTVRNPNYRGITVPFWSNLKKVGDASTSGVYGTPNCGKGEPNQIIRVGHASPVCLFENIEVFGGA